jgi:hypothetical protein
VHGAEQDAVDPLAAQHVDLLGLKPEQVVGVAEDDGVAAAAGGVGDGLGRPRVERVGEVGHDEPERARAAAGQAAGDAVGHEA